MDSSDEPVRIVPYDPAWPARFEQERALLQLTIGEWAAGGIHHVGSTAVRGLAAKPVIDVLVGVVDLELPRRCFAALASIGYLYAPYRAEQMHWFCKPHPSRRSHHLHLVPLDAPRFREELLFRDHLRAHADVAARYEVLKRALAERYEDDRDAYSEAKSQFIAATLRLAGRRADGARRL